MTWIVDSGASDHMTGNLMVFHEYTPCHDNFSERIADGTLSRVVGTGSVVISKDITLHSMLYVSKVDRNLLSISRLTQDLNCVTKFLPHVCEFQALDSRKRIGNAEVSVGLYLLRAEENQRQPMKIACVVSSPSTNKDSDVMLWHYRLGHPNFLYLQKLYPSLFNKNSRNFQSEICQLSKHTRNSYTIQPYKSSHPLSLIHSDVWGDSRFNNITVLDGLSPLLMTTLE